MKKTKEAVRSRRSICLK